MALSFKKKNKVLLVCFNMLLLRKSNLMELEVLLKTKNLLLQPACVAVYDHMAHS